MKVKTFFEVSDGGFSVQRRQLEEADKVVAFSFSDIDQEKTAGEIFIMGEFGTRDIESIAVSVANVLTKITAGRLHEPVLWTLFEKRFRMEMTKYAKDEAGELEAAMRKDFSESGSSQEEIDRFFERLNKIAEEVAGIV